MHSVCSSGASKEDSPKNQLEFLVNVALIKHFRRKRAASESRSCLCMSIWRSCGCHDPGEVQRGLSLILLLPRKSVLCFRALLFSCLQRILAEVLTPLPLPLPYPHKGSASSTEVAGGECPASAALSSHHVLSSVLIHEWKDAAPKDGGVSHLYSAS